MAFRSASTATYTFASGSTGSTVDLGANNNYRYINATNVYNKGKSDGGSGVFPFMIDPGPTRNENAMYRTNLYTNADTVYLLFGCMVTGASSNSYYFEYNGTSKTYNNKYDAPTNYGAYGLYIKKFTGSFNIGSDVSFSGSQGGNSCPGGASIIYGNSSNITFDYNTNTGGSKSIILTKNVNYIYLLCGSNVAYFEYNGITYNYSNYWKYISPCSNNSGYGLYIWIFKGTFTSGSTLKYPYFAGGSAIFY